MGQGASAGTALTVISAAAGAYSTYQQAKARKIISKANEYIYGIKRDIAERQAVDALKRGHAVEAAARKKAVGVLGAQKAAFAGQNVRVGFGSPKEVEEETFDVAVDTMLTIRINAMREALGYESAARGFNMQRFHQQFQTKSIESAGRVETVGAVLSGASQVYTAYQAYTADAEAGGK